MPRFEVEIEGENLDEAMAELNAAGIPTISAGAGGAVSQIGADRRSLLRRPGFWIVVVILVAFFAQRLISPAVDEESPTYSEFTAQIERQPNSFAMVTLDPDNTTAEVSERDGEEYEVGYPPSGEEELVELLRRQQVETVVEQTGGGSILSWLLYLLPFLLIIGFWAFLNVRMRRGYTAPDSSSGDPNHEQLKAVLDATSAEAAEERVRGCLPQGSWRVRDAQSWR